MIPKTTPFYYPARSVVMRSVIPGKRSRCSLGKFTESFSYTNSDATCGCGTSAIQRRCEPAGDDAYDRANNVTDRRRDRPPTRPAASPRRVRVAVAQRRAGGLGRHRAGFRRVGRGIPGWRDSRYGEVEDEAVRKKLHTWLHEALRYWVNPRTGEIRLIDFESNPGTVKAALDTIKAITHLPASVTSPSWLRDGANRPPALEILPCRSGLLHLPTMRQFDPTPQFFSTSALDFDPDPSSPPPMEWLGFLHQLFDGDGESLDLLQEWFGYCLICDTSQQKMLLIVGPRRSGKGTIARVLTRLVGPANVCGPATSSLAGAFGLQPLLTKSLAIVSDARFHGENIQTVVERLLCISGEDTLTVDRKHMTSVTLKLPTRFVFLTNEFPRLTDARGALAGRFVILRLTESFYGKKDPLLTAKLLVELTGILNWAIEGCHRLRERGHFVMPGSVRDVVQEIEDLSSPVAAFVRKECVVGPGRRVWVDDLYDAWESWCEREGRTLVSTKQAFGRNLAAAVAGVSRRRGAGDVPFYEGIDLKENQP